MKYIKTYENNKYKKYMLYLHPNKYEIFLDIFVKVENDEIYFQIKNKYNIKNDTWSGDDSYNFETINKSDEQNYKKNLLFTSNSMDNCLDFINTYVESKKYNL